MVAGVRGEVHGAGGESTDKGPPRELFGAPCPELGLEGAPADDVASALLSRARAALEPFEGWPEERVDTLLRAIAEGIAEQAGPLALQSSIETGIGNQVDKIVKIRFAALEVLRSLEGRRAAGIIHEDIVMGVTEVASPVGVVLGLIPVTNPIATLVFKTLIALKGRNAIVFSSHRKAQGTCIQAAQVIRGAIEAHGAPVDLVQCVPGRTDRARTIALMSHPDTALILATGGSGMVRAAYSSGTPAIGVGPGNAPAFIHRAADLPRSAEHVVRSKSFDHGIICGSEHHLVVDEAVVEPFCRELTRQGAAVLATDESSRLEAIFFESGKVRGEWIGQSAAQIAEAAAIERSFSMRLLVAPLGLCAIDGPYGLEKLAPVLSLFVTEGDDHGLAICRRILRREGSGHTAVIHSRDDAFIRRFGCEIEASRILVNSPASLGCIGFGNGLTPSLTLGAGTFSGNSTTDNVGYRHLLNIKRIARPLGFT
jgi:acetaldehyde dehydrogenase / alcohol dehydrogenase